MKIILQKNDGTLKELEAEPGWRVMEILRDWGEPIKAECGGACACATCHVYIAPEWKNRLQRPTEDEIHMLDDAPGVTDFSRLSCQLIMSEALNGLTVSLAPGSEPE